MRCYLMRGGHFKGVEVVDAVTDAEAVQCAIKLFYERQESRIHDPYDGFELWDGNRLVHKHQPVSKAG